MNFRTTSQFLISLISPKRLFYGFSLIWFRGVSFKYIFLKLCLYFHEVLALQVVPTCSQARDLRTLRL